MSLFLLFCWLVSEVPADATEQSEPQAILGGDETKVETEPTEIAGTDGANVEDAAPPPPAENASGESENPVEGEVEATAAPSEPNTTQSAGEEAPAEGAPAEGFALFRNTEY